MHRIIIFEYVTMRHFLDKMSFPSQIVSILHNITINPPNFHFQKVELKPHILTSFDIFCNLMDDNLQA